MEVKPGFKQTEIGVIPADWDVHPITSLLEKGTRITYGVVQPGSNDPNGVLFIRGGDVFAGKVLESQLRRIPKSISEQFARTKLRGGEIVISLVGYPAEVAIVPSRLSEANIARQVALVRVAEERPVARDYLAKYLQSPDGRKSLLKEAIGSAQQVINLRDVNRIHIPSPPTKAEQEAIAGALSDADALIESLEQLIAKKRQIKQGAMQELLTGRRRLPGFKGEWEQRSLGSEILELDAGVSVNSKVDATDSEDAEAAVLKTSCVETGRFLPSESKPIADHDRTRAKLNPRADTILISRMNTVELVGECGYVAKDYPTLYVPDRLWMTRFRRDASVSPRWLAYLLSSHSFRQQLREIATGTSGSMKNIAKGSLLALTAAFPSRPEQSAIARLLSDMDADHEALEIKLRKARLLKQGMMQELLTGRIRLVESGKLKVENERRESAAVES